MAFYSSFSVANSAQSNCGITLGELKWKKRVLIYNANSSKELNDLKTFAQYNRVALTERKLLVIGIVEQQPVVVFGYPKCHVTLGKLKPENKVTLIGLDSTIKAKYDTFDSALIYSTIDKMPMRKTELGRYWELFLKKHYCEYYFWHGKQYLDL